MWKSSPAASFFKTNPRIFWLSAIFQTAAKSKRELERTRQLESIAALSGGIAHDYNNLLTAIIGNISLAQTYLDPDDKVFLLLSQALAASKTAKDLTQKLITFSKGGSPDKKIVEVAKLVKNATLNSR